MSGRLLLVWDYDSGIGQINATYPYNFRIKPILEEIENVETILKLGMEYDVRMTFACLGANAEQGYFPYQNPEQIIKIYSAGHEIASHSWRHEWFPYLTAEQIKRSLTRSKYALETCIGRPGSVVGFVPPFSRPMSWYRKAAFSKGDRVFGPWYPGASLGSLIKFAAVAGYKWCRVSFKPLGRSNTSFFRESNMMCIPGLYNGFDAPAVELLENAVRNNSVVVVSGHPSGLTRNGNENVNALRIFLHTVAELQMRGVLQSTTVSSYMESQSHE